MVEGLALHGLTDPFDAEIWYGERVAVLGPNGAGKSHFLRLVAGDTSIAHDGEVKLGARVVPGHFSQTHEHPEWHGRTLLELLEAHDVVRVAGHGHAAPLRASNERPNSASSPTVGRPASPLPDPAARTGGATLLLLDEPTDNLDLESAEAEDGLSVFEWNGRRRHLRPLVPTAASTASSCSTRTARSRTCSSHRASTAEAGAWPVREHRPVTTGRIIAGIDGSSGADAAALGGRRGRHPRRRARRPHGLGLPRPPRPRSRRLRPFVRAGGRRARDAIRRLGVGPRSTGLSPCRRKRISPARALLECRRRRRSARDGRPGCRRLPGTPRRVGDATLSERDHRPAGARPRGTPRRSERPIGGRRRRFRQRGGGVPLGARRGRAPRRSTKRRCTHGRSPRRVANRSGSSSTTPHSKRRRWTRSRRPRRPTAGPTGHRRASRAARTSLHLSSSRSRRRPPWSSGHRGHRRWGRAALGSVAQQVAHYSRCLVVVVPIPPDTGRRTPRDPVPSPAWTAWRSKATSADGGGLRARPAFGPDDVELARRAIEANLGSPRPTPAASADDDGAFIEDFCSWQRLPRWRRSSGPRPPPPSPRS